MRAFVQTLSTNPKYSRAFHWGKLITITGSAQAIVQIIGLLSGVFIIRLLSTQEYALYTLANTMLGVMVLLADGGIATSVMSQGGKVWQDPARLGSVLVTGFELRKKFALASLLVAVPILFYFLRHHGTSWMITLVVTFSLIPSFLTALSGTLLEIPPKLHQDIAPVQKTQVLVNVSRLLLLVVTLYTFPFAFVAILASGSPQIWGNLRLRKISKNYADYTQPSNSSDRKDIVAIVTRIFPYTVYYCFSGQITIWLISIFGSTETIAQAGALGRLSMLLSLFSVLFGTLISPRFARLQTNSKILLTRYVQIFGGLIVLCVCITGFVWLFPSEVLWILGKQYLNLTTELLLSIIASCLNLIAGSLYALYSSRGWAINPVVSISISIASIGSGMFLIDVSSLQGVLIFNIFIALVQMIMSAFYCFYKIMKAENGQKINLRPNW